MGFNNKPGYKPNDEQYTPKELFDALGLEFDLDVATPCEGTIYTPTKTKYCPCDNGLEKSWSGLVWCNPPFSSPALWAHKWLNHANGVLLIMGSKAKWRLNLWNDPRTNVINIKPPKFVRPDGKSGQIMFPVDLWAIGDIATTALKQSGLGRVR